MFEATWGTPGKGLCQAASISPATPGVYRFPAAAMPLPGQPWSRAAGPSPGAALPSSAHQHPPFPTLSPRFKTGSVSLAGPARTHPRLPRSGPSAGREGTALAASGKLVGATREPPERGRGTSSPPASGLGRSPIPGANGPFAV